MIPVGWDGFLLCPWQLSLGSHQFICIAVLLETSWDQTRHGSRSRKRGCIPKITNLAGKNPNKSTHCAFPTLQVMVSTFGVEICSSSSSSSSCLQVSFWCVARWTSPRFLPEVLRAGLENQAWFGSVARWTSQIMRDEKWWRYARRCQICIDMCQRNCQICRKKVPDQISE